MEPPPDNARPVGQEGHDDPVDRGGVYVLGHDMRLDPALGTEPTGSPPPEDRDGPADHCGVYIPGHDVHFIPALRMGRPDSPAPDPGVLLRVDPDGTFEIRVGDEVRKLWNHDPERLERLIRRCGGAVEHHPRWQLLTASQGPGERYCFNVCVAERAQPCPEEPPSLDWLVELFAEAGFPIPCGGGGEDGTAREPG